jgi:hypothetical protein
MPELGLFFVKVRQSRTRLSAGKARRISVSIEIEPVGFAEEASCSGSAHTAWLRQHRNAGPLLSDCTLQ